MEKGAPQAKGRAQEWTCLKKGLHSWRQGERRSEMMLEGEARAKSQVIGCHALSFFFLLYFGCSACETPPSCVWGAPHFSSVVRRLAGFPFQKLSSRWLGVFTANQKHPPRFWIWSQKQSSEEFSSCLGRYGYDSSSASRVLAVPAVASISSAWPSAFWAAHILLLISLLPDGLASISSKWQYFLINFFAL